MSDTCNNFDEVVNSLNSEDNILAMTFFPSSPVSTNDMYIPVSKGKNTRRGYYLKSSALKEYQETLFKEITDIYQDKIIRFLDYCNSNYDRLGFNVELFIGINDLNYKQKSIQHDLRPYDASNYIKSTEDIIASRLEIDDKYNMRVSVLKYKSSEDSWRTTVIIKPVDYSRFNDDFIFDKLKNERSESI